MKKLLVVLAVLFIGILLAGCTSQPAAPVATPVPTPVPTVVTVPPTPVPTPTKEIIIIIENKTTPVPTPTATPTPRPTYTITFTQSMTILPGTTMTVPVGSTVVWKNEDSLKPHSIMATDPSDGAWFGGATEATIPVGKSFAVTFNKTGTFEYKTVFQPETTGVITVK